MATEIMIEKVTGNFKLAGIRGTFEDGRVKFGLAIAKRGRKGWDVAWGYSESQVRSLIKKHNASNNDPNILYCC